MACFWGGKLVTSRLEARLHLMVESEQTRGHISFGCGFAACFGSANQPRDHCRARAVRRALHSGDSGCRVWLLLGRLVRPGLPAPGPDGVAPLGGWRGCAFSRPCHSGLWRCTGVCRLGFDSCPARTGVLHATRGPGGRDDARGALHSLEQVFGCSEDVACQARSWASRPVAPALSFGAAGLCCDDCGVAGRP